MYCETAEEQECFNKLKLEYPLQNAYLLDLLAWVFINKPERFEEIMEEHKKLGSDAMIDLENFDIKTIMKKEA
jgi:hypothetical protein